MSANPSIGARPAGAPELPALTSLRGLAALTIVVYHARLLALHGAGHSVPAVGTLWGRGYLAVDLFFMLSGFVLTHVYGRRFLGDRSWPALGKFFWARFSRVYPTSLFVTVLCVLEYAIGASVVPAGVSFKSQLVAALTLMQVPWLNQVWINGPSWSVSAELYAYILFPFILPAICRLRGRAAIGLGVILLLEVAILAVPQQNWGWGALFRALPEFAAGILAYRIYRENVFLKFWQSDATLIGTAAMIVAACLFGVSDAPILVLLWVLLLAAVRNIGRMGRILDAAPLRWLGDISYSVYIFQWLPLMAAAGIAARLAAHGAGAWLFAVPLVLVILGSGALVHRCVDFPARMALRRLPDRLIALAAKLREAKAPAVRSASAQSSEP